MGLKRLVNRTLVAVLALMALLALGACSATNPNGPSPSGGPSVPGSNLDYGMVTFTYYRDVACTRLCELNVRLGNIPGTWPQAYDLQLLNHGSAPQMTSQDGGVTWSIVVKTPSKDGLCVAILDPNQEANRGQTGLRITAITPNGTRVPLNGNAAQACFGYAPPDRLIPQS